MIATRTLIFILPVALYLIWFFGARLLRRTPRRQTANVVLSLLLLAYFSAVVGTGLFWVAAQDLPAFDWHYALGYILLLLTAAHVILNWRAVTRLGGTARVRGGWRALGLLLLGGVIGLVAFGLGARHGSETIRVTVHDTAARPVGKEYQVVEISGEALSLAQFYHRGSSYPARAPLVGVTWRLRPMDAKTYTEKSMIKLPESRRRGGGDVLAAIERWRTQDLTGGFLPSTLSFADLALILYHAQGTTRSVTYPAGTFHFRAAPSAGALYPVNLYVAAHRVEGLEPGLYYYDPKEHRLALLQSGDPATRIAQFSGSPHLYEPAACTLLLTVTFARTGFKYKERCYRYVNMDAGHVAANAAYVATAQGYGAPIIARFDDDAFNTYLEIGGHEEAGLALMPIGRVNEAFGERPFPEPRFALQPPGAAEVTYLELIHQGTAFERLATWGPLPRSTAEPHPREQNAQFALSQPEVGSDLFDSIRLRRSVREHGAAGITAAELATLCRSACAGEEAREPLHALTPPLQLYVLVRDVADLEAGCYLYDATARQLRLLRAGDFSKAAFQAMLQQDFCRSADVLFVKTFDWEGITAPDGDRGYRYACQLAGVSGEGLYLTATALGLGACGVGAFLDEEVAALVDCDPSRIAVLYVTAVGR